MRALLDTDVVLDVILAREPFARISANLLNLNEQGLFDAYISGITPINIFYIAHKAKVSGDLKEAIRQLLLTVRVCPITHNILNQALALPFADYETQSNTQAQRQVGLMRLSRATLRIIKTRRSLSFRQQTFLIN